MGFIIRLVEMCNILMSAMFALFQAGWQKQLRSVESFAERQIRELKEKLEVRTAEAVSNKEVASARLADLEEELVTWQRKHAAMANAHDSAEAEMRAVKARILIKFCIPGMISG